MGGICVMSVLRKLLARAKRNVLTWYWQRKFNIGKDTCIIRPLRIAGREGICIGDHVVINEGCWIECQPLTTNPNPRLVISEGCVLGHFNEIYSTSDIILEKYLIIRLCTCYIRSY